MKLEVEQVIASPFVFPLSHFIALFSMAEHCLHSTGYSAKNVSVLLVFCNLQPIYIATADILTKLHSLLKLYN